MSVLQKLLVREGLPRFASAVTCRVAPRLAQVTFHHAAREAGTPSKLKISSLLLKPPVRWATSASHKLNMSTRRDDLDAKIVYQGLDEKQHELSHHLHSSWTDDELRAVKIEHVEPQKMVDKLAHYTVQTARQLYDIFTGYKWGTRDENCYVKRIIFLETIAGVPGMVGAMVRHFNSLRRMRRDYGWIHTLLEEAENERMHLMCAMLLIDKPSFFLRWVILLSQFIFMGFYTTAYMMSSRFCHRFVGYIEEEAIKTYTGLIKDMEAGKLPGLDMAAHPTMRAYWQMSPDSRFLDVVYMIRADESHHREVNHTFADMKPTDVNPFHPGY